MTKKKKHQPKTTSVSASTTRAAYLLGFYHRAIFPGIRLVFGEFGLNLSKTEVLNGVAPLKGAIRRLMPPARSRQLEKKLNKVYGYVTKLKTGDYKDRETGEAMFNAIEDLCKEVQAESEEFAAGDLDGRAGMAFTAGSRLSAWHGRSDPPFGLSASAASVLVKSLTAAKLPAAAQKVLEINTTDEEESIGLSTKIWNIHNSIIRSLDEQVSEELMVGPAASKFVSPLTGLPTVAQLDIDLESRLIEASALNVPVSLAFLDLDNLKALNKQIGHDSADGVIKDFGRILVNGFSERGVVYHRSGDEFMVPLYNHTGEEAHELVSRVIKRVASTDFVVGADKIQVTASAGIASCPDAADRGVLKKRATAAMQRSKDDGKSRATIWKDGMTFEKGE